ncbi:adaptin family protein [Actinidia rufa]|uniref:Beta-adaptin-like protein n=1 Tax=Actinidia rufa TaxID=165716 RepID=A0A7J0DHH2_9ERIC|nr:adaptin family protein [Actinidia rufa]
MGLERHCWVQTESPLKYEKKCCPLSPDFGGDFIRPLLNSSSPFIRFTSSKPISSLFTGDRFLSASIEYNDGSSSSISPLSFSFAFSTLRSSVESNDGIWNSRSDPDFDNSHPKPNSTRKGEVSDLKMQLRQLAGSRAPGTDDSKRELFKKVISYMTIGIDVSSVFSEMVMCSATSDIVLKKMCYLYVGNHAKYNPDLALLTINFLQKDCKDEDPMIRGLALRSLCSLRVANLVEYLVGPLGLGLKDGNSYVRTVATVGVLKLYHISSATCVDADFPTMLKHLMLSDPDTQVVANCLSALQEIWSLEASKSEEASREKEALLSKPVVYYFLNRIKEFSEWAQCLVLELVAKYVPSDSNEIFDVMNLLEDRLQHANGAVVLATIKLFLQLTLSMTDVHQQVYERIKAPLLTLVSSGSPEQSYAVLSHLHLLVTRAPMLFSSDYKHFYCQYNEPFYVKKLKLEMLTALASESNTYEIVTELCEYAANVDIPIARESIRAVGKIALQQYDVNAIVDRLLQFLEMEKDYVTAETLVLVKDLLRKYPQWSHDCIAVVGNISSKNVQEPKAKAALIWMLGEYAQDMQDAPYVLESLIDNWEDEYSAEVRLHLLTAVMKCFLRRPPETQKALGDALAAGIADFHQDVHDRALFYYRLLQYNVSVAERVVNPPKQAVSVFADPQNSEIKDRIFDEFNSLSVVYQKPSYMFTDKEHRGPFVFSEELGNLSIGVESASNVVSTQMLEANDNDLLLSTSEKEESRGASSNGSAYNAPSTDGSSNQLLATHSPQPSMAIDDLLGLGLPVAPNPAPSPPPLKLNARAVLDPSTFQQKWRQLPISVSQEYSMNPQGVAALTTPQSLLQHMQGNYIQCIASGGQAPNFKFFFFAQKAEESSTFLVECVINSASCMAQLKIKADDQSTSQAFAALFQSALSTFGMT